MTTTKATAAAVSRALTEAGVAKSRSEGTRIRGYRRGTQGFSAVNVTAYDPDADKRVPTGTVTVHWMSGNFMRLDDDAAREASSLAQVAEILTGKGFTVQTNTDGDRTTLTVTR